MMHPDNDPNCQITQYYHRRDSYKEVLRKDGKAAYGRLAFWYRSSSGFNFRIVDVTRYYSAYYDESILGYCHLRGEERVFNESKMEGIFDVIANQKFKSIYDWVKVASSNPVLLPEVSPEDFVRLGRLDPEFTKNDIEKMFFDLAEKIKEFGVLRRFYVADEHSIDRLCINIYRPKLRGKGEMMDGYIWYHPFHMTFISDAEPGERRMQEKVVDVCPWQVSEVGGRVKIALWSDVEKYLLERFLNSASQGGSKV